MVGASFEEGQVRVETWGCHYDGELDRLPWEGDRAVWGCRERL